MKILTQLGSDGSSPKNISQGLESQALAGPCLGPFERHFLPKRATKSFGLIKSAVITSLLLFICSEQIL